VLDWSALPVPAVLLLVGINGSGKTTTAAKLAHQALRAGRKPLLGAADTFRAAGSHQLKVWADRIGCEAVIGATGGDAAAVAYDAIDAALARQCDTVIVDTAGRMHTREPLMRELQKIRAAMDKRLPGAPQHTWVVLDAMLGQNAVVQARQFHEITPLTGAVVTKLDGSSKGGFLFAIRQELEIPVYFAGLGEGADDLAPFDPESFVAAMLNPEGAP
jgi:fused signal recognition particle receptor